MNYKMKAGTELDNLITISEYFYSKSNDGRHPFAKDGWNYCKTVFQIDGKQFECIVNIAKSRDKRTLYDITNIKRTIQNYSTSDKPFSVLSNDSNNRIAQNANPVKENIKNVLSKVKLRFLYH